MHVRMVKSEVEEAVREWLQKRGIEAPGNEIEFRCKLTFAGNHRADEVVSGTPIDIIGIELPVKEGPYR